MKTIAISLKIFLFFTVLTGVAYPLFITGIAQLVFPTKANGSIITINQKPIGSMLIGQQFDSSIYFDSRPSAISYNPLPSGGSNYGLTSTKLKELVQERRNHFLKFNNLNSHTDVPSEMLFASASGLDPHISPQAALLQVNRIAKARNYSTVQKQELLHKLDSLIEPPQFICLGEPRVNVLLLNLETDKIK
ncbi:MAG TPA: potassium-transporting ATPase subunit KdpC [Williamwhitmania sp.]|nr:potassium-transporting ATPase subunit KdpC [Williamwhitmania sp.]